MDQGTTALYLSDRGVGLRFIGCVFGPLQKLRRKIKGGALSVVDLDAVSAVSGKILAKGERLKLGCEHWKNLEVTRARFHFC